MVMQLLSLLIDVVIACKWHDQAERTCPHREAFELEPLAKQASVLAWPMASRPTFLWQAMRLVSRHLFIVARAAARPTYSQFYRDLRHSYIPTPFLSSYILFYLASSITSDLTHILESNISARREIEEYAQVELHFVWLCLSISRTLMDRDYSSLRKIDFFKSNQN